MSRLVDNIFTLQNNVFALTPLLISFYKKLQSREKDMLLAYFVFPLVLNQECIENIKQLNRHSQLSRITRDKEIMAGFEERFEFYKDITNRCLQYALDCGYIEIDKNLTVHVISNEQMFTDPILTNSLKLSSILYRVFTRNVINTYYSFGIKKL